MANTVIALRSSGVASNTPSLGVLANGELSINFADGILYYKSSSNTLGSIRTTAVSGLTTEVQFNDAGVFGANANFTFNKTLATLNVKNINVSTNLVTVNLTATSITTGTGAGGIIAGANVIYSNVFVANSGGYVQFSDGSKQYVANAAPTTIAASIITGVMNLTQGGTNASSYTSGTFLTSNGTAFVSVANTGTAGTYGNSSYNPVITTDAYGRVSAVTNTLIQISTTQVTSGILPFAQGGTNAASYTTGNLVISNGTSLVSLANTGTAGTYGNSAYVPIITTDAYGRVTSVSNVAIVPSGIANTTVTDDTFTGTGSTTIYTMAAAATQNTVFVAINGVLQPNTAYTIVGTNTTITMTEAPGLNDTVNIKRITGAGASGGGSSTSLTTSNTTLTATSNGTTLVVGNFASTGDAIQKQYLVRNTTTNATESELMIDVSNRISVNTNTTVFFTADIVARRTDAINESASFFLKGVADNFSGTVAAVGSLYEVIVARDDASYLVDVRANNTTKTLNIYVTGVAGKTIRWVGNINTVEVAQ